MRFKSYKRFRQLFANGLQTTHSPFIMHTSSGCAILNRNEKADLRKWREEEMVTTILYWRRKSILPYLSYITKFTSFRTNFRNLRAAFCLQISKQYCRLGFLLRNFDAFRVVQIMRKSMDASVTSNLGDCVSNAY